MYTSKSTKIKGYHGTYSKYLDSILANNFYESENHQIWMGDGVYFFIDGIGIEPPMEYAKMYAHDKCYDKGTKTHRDEEICVLEAMIKVNEGDLLDLTIDSGNQLFNKFRAEVLRMIEESGNQSITKYRDADVFKIMRKRLGIEFVKVHVYIKFGRHRKENTLSEIPNVSIFVVNEPKKNILKASIRTVFKGKIV